jgi:hypothetical protein
LVDGLPESDPTLNVVTPNYDMLAEYSFEKVGIKYINGFIGSLYRKIDWAQSRRSICYSEKNIQRNKVKFISKKYKHIELHKVHGSLNTFIHNDQVIEANSWIYEPPADVERVIITPGISKYEKISQFRQELIAKYDEIVENKDAFIFIGYGFNDAHIEQYLRPKLKNMKCHGIIITRDNNKRIEDLLDLSDNLWLICKQDLDNNTRIKNKNYEDWLYLKDCYIWNIQEFTKEILGD